MLSSRLHSNHFPPRFKPDSTTVFYHTCFLWSVTSVVLPSVSEPPNVQGVTGFVKHIDLAINTARAEEHLYGLKGAMAMRIPAAIRGPSDTRLAPEIPFYLKLYLFH